MHDHTDPYIEFLLSRKDKIFYRKPYPGNAGDELIQKGSQAILSDLDIQETVDPFKADVILFPGGNPTMWAGIGVRSWRKLWNNFPNKEFVVGPAGFRQGYSNWAEAIKQEGASVTALFARDPLSYDVLKNSQLPSSIVLGLSHDPALYLRNSTWIHAHKEAATEEYILASFRDDHESNVYFPKLFDLLRRTSTRIHRELSRIEAGFTRRRKIQIASKNTSNANPLLICDASKQRIEMFLETVRRAKEVHTDRLHVLLLAAMLEKKVFAYQTCHGKLETVSDHSLKDWADITFVSLK